MSSDVHKMTVSILMATWNGARFIREQLESIASQRDVEVRLHVSDDGSSDRTVDLIRAFSDQNPWLPISISRGPGNGFVRNFLSMVCDPTIDGDYFAYCDQDDVWHADKLEIALAALDGASMNKPAVYTSRTRTIADDGEAKGMSPLFERPPSLKNALVQSIGGGNTMVFNSAAREILIQAGADLDVPSHDWWTYLAVTACGGIAIYDPAPHIDYRQHSENIVGENSSVTARIFRIKLLLSGRFQNWLDANLDALQRLETSIPPANRSLIDEFRALRRDVSAWRRLNGISRLGLYRQTPFGDISLAVAAALRKL